VQGICFAEDESSTGALRKGGNKYPSHQEEPRNLAITADEDPVERWVRDPKDTLQPALNKHHDQVVDKLAEAWLFVLEMLEDEDKES
jgi:hypothetical protein